MKVGVVWFGPPCTCNLYIMKCGFFSVNIMLSHGLSLVNNLWCLRSAVMAVGSTVRHTYTFLVFCGCIYVELEFTKMPAYIGRLFFLNTSRRSSIPSHVFVNQPFTVNCVAYLYHDDQSRYREHKFIVPPMRAAKHPGRKYLFVFWPVSAQDEVY